MIRALIDFVTGMGGLDIFAVTLALLIFLAYAFICAASLLKHEIEVFRGEIDPEDYEEDDEIEYYSDDEKEWH